MGFWSDSVEDDYDDYEVEQKLTTLNLAVPVNVAYQFAVGENFTIEPFVGLNLKFNALADLKFTETYDGDEESESISMFDKDLDKDARWKRFQLGWHVGANLLLQNKYYLNLQYGTDFMAICKKTNTSTFSVGLGLNF